MSRRTLFSLTALLRAPEYCWTYIPIFPWQSALVSVFCDCRMLATSNIRWRCYCSVLRDLGCYYDLGWLLPDSTIHHWIAWSELHLGIPAQTLSDRPPRVRTITFPPCHCRLYQGLLRVVSDFSLLCNLIRAPWPYSRFLFISAVVCSSGSLRIPPHDGHPCPWLVVPTTTAHSGLSPPSYHPCRAHTKTRHSFECRVYIIIFITM